MDLQMIMSICLDSIEAGPGSPATPAAWAPGADTSGKTVRNVSPAPGGVRCIGSACVIDRMVGATAAVHLWREHRAAGVHALRHGAHVCGPVVQQSSRGVFSGCARGNVIACTEIGQGMMRRSSPGQGGATGCGEGCQ